jgi:hypothetical protein
METKRIVLGVFLAAALLGAGLANAGSVSNQLVVFGTIDGFENAKGALRAVRSSSDTVQYIGCSRYAYSTGSTSIVCQAKNAAGALKSCSTSNDQMLRVAETLNPAAYLMFAVNPDGSCNRVITTLYSYNL